MKYVKYGVILFFFMQQVMAQLIFRTDSSVLQVNSGAGFFVGKKIENCKGTIFKQQGAILSGLDIEFNKGWFEDEECLEKIIGTMRADGTIVLDGNKTFQGENGQTAQSIIVSGQNNIIEGTVLLNGAFSLQDANTTVTFALSRLFPQDIELNGGTIFLEENFGFVDGKKFTGTGIIRCNRRKLSYGGKDLALDSSVFFDQDSNLEINANLSLSQTVTFSGQNNTIIGNGNILDLSLGGNIVVERGSVLTLSNVVLKGASASNIRCLDDSAKIIFQDVTWAQSGNFVFEKGSFDVVGFLNLTTPYTFAYCSIVESVVKSNSTLKLDTGFTFSYDPLNDEKNLIQFQDQTSILSLSGARLHVCCQGMELTKGCLMVNSQSSLVVEDDEGLILGDNTIENDMDCIIRLGSMLDVLVGKFIYRNVDASAWNMINNNSILRMNTRTTLQLEQPLLLGNGRLMLNQYSALAKIGSGDIVGPVEFFA